MAWFALVTAGLLEVCWALALKRSDGLTRLPETALFVAALVASMLLLTRALRDLPVGTGYAGWTGIGAVGAFAAGVVLLGESASAARLASVALVTAGIAGLAVTGAH